MVPRRFQNCFEAGDAQAVTALDRTAMVIGLLDQEPISALSLLRVSGQYAHLGNYLVHPAHRGGGFGLATWRAVLPHAAGRVIGLDAVPDRVDTYRGPGRARRRPEAPASWSRAFRVPRGCSACCAADGLDTASPSAPSP
jgi:GNAT superfamily N-acetyltransferase